MARRVAVGDRVADWIFPPRGAERGPVMLTQRRIYIIPSRQGWLFAATLMLMLLGSINYNLGLGYVLTFLLAGLGVVGMLHTWRNLAHLQIQPGRVDPVFVGEFARFGVVLVNPAGFGRVSIGCDRAEAVVAFADVGPRDAATVAVEVPTVARGMLPFGRFRLFTGYPVGLFYAWSRLELDLTALVYPKPEAGEPALPVTADRDGDAGLRGRGTDDFAGLRDYHPGDPPRHIAWKSAARSDRLYTKLFEGSSGRELLLDWADTPMANAPEARLSRLARWVLMADERGCDYGLQLPGRRIPPSNGNSHRHACLEALALFDAHGTGNPGVPTATGEQP